VVLVGSDWFLWYSASDFPAATLLDEKGRTATKANEMQRGQAGNYRSSHFDIRLRWRPETEAAEYVVVSPEAAEYDASVRFINEAFLSAHETKMG